MGLTEDLENLNTIIQYQNGFIISKIMFAACELGVFDLLFESEELLTSKMIADRLDSKPREMERLLDSCVGLKLLRVERKENQAFYGNTDLSTHYIAKSSLKSQRNYMIALSETIYPGMHSLADIVRQGKNDNEKSYDTGSKNLFDVVYRSEEQVKKFIKAMNDNWILCGRDVIAAFDLSLFSVVYDMGGASGGLAKEWVSLYPNSTVTIGDLPEVVEIAKKDFVSAEEHRINFHAVDFFKDPVPEADLYVLARILLDWEDEKCVQLLSQVYNACKPGGGVLIVEILLSEDKSEPLEAQCLTTLLQVFSEGRVRTLSEYSSFLSAAGFQEIKAKKTRTRYDAILARK